MSSIIRLGTQYGGGKTHSLIALVHAVRGMKGVPTPGNFVDPAILPSGAVRIAALDGENADPANGLTLEPGLLARSLWGEMAYRLAGRAGYERVRASDEKHIAPGAETIRELFGGQPTLILLDEISVYLRKVERAFPDASKQFAAFIHDLFKAVASTPQVALVYTLAVGKDDKAGDAYKEENERAAAAMSEAESVAVRSTTPLNPTEEDETPNVLRARLFETVDLGAAQSVIAAYSQVWNANRDALPADAADPGTPRPVRAQLPAPSQAARNADREDRVAQHVPTHARHAAVAGPHRSPPLENSAAGRLLDPHAPHGPGLRADPHRDQRQARPRPVRASRQIRCRRRGGRRAGSRAAHRCPEVPRPAACDGLCGAHDLLAHAGLRRLRQGASPPSN